MINEKKNLIFILFLKISTLMNVLLIRELNRVGRPRIISMKKMTTRPTKTKTPMKRGRPRAIIMRNLRK